MDLASLDSLYTSTEAKGAPDALPDGTYQASVHMVDLMETSTKKPMLAFQLKVAAGPHVGRLLFVNRVITDKTLPYVKQDLTTLGWTGTLSGLQDPIARRALLDVIVECKQVTKGTDDQGRPNTNVYINRRIDTATAVAGGAVDPNKTPF
jgi:hypothetical protein